MEKTESQTFSQRLTHFKMRTQKGFTLVELIVSAGLSGIIMVGVLSCFLMLGRMGANIQNYTDMESRGRKALELFGREVRMAYDVDSGITINNTPLSATSLRLYIPDTTSTPSGTSTGSYTVTYAFSGNNFTRNGPPVDEPSGAVTTTILMTDVQQIGANPYFNFYKHLNTFYYDTLNPLTPKTAGSYNETKQVEVNFLVSRQSKTVTTATNKVLSARFILRNK
jgi:prepilin-type N-terminal cleavage/methylation domain-containing protein